MWGIEKIFTSSYEGKRGNAKVERQHQTLENILSALSSDCNDWSKNLPLVELAMRANPIRSQGGLSPFEIVHAGRKMKLPVDLMCMTPNEDMDVDLGDYLNKLKQDVKKVNDLVKENTEVDHEAYKERYDRTKSRQYPFHEGQYVFLNDPVVGADWESRKIRQRWKGPFVITKEVTSHTMALKNPITEKIIEHPVHVDRLKPAYGFDEQEDDADKEDSEGEDQPPQGQESANATEGDKTGADTYYAAERIVGQKNLRSGKQYLVKWVGHSLNEWVPSTNVTKPLEEAWLKNHTLLGKKRKTPKN